jgi:hypothetical protein
MFGYEMLQERNRGHREQLMREAGAERLARQARARRMRRRRRLAFDAAFGRFGAARRAQNA